MGTWNPREGLGAKSPENGGLGRSQYCLAKVNSNFTHTAASSPPALHKGGCILPCMRHRLWWDCRPYGGCATSSDLRRHRASTVADKNVYHRSTSTADARRTRHGQTIQCTAAPTAYYSRGLQQQYHRRRCSRFPSSVSSLLLEMRLN